MFHSPGKQVTTEIASMIAHLKNVGNLPTENNVSASESTIGKTAHESLATEIDHQRCGCLKRIGQGIGKRPSDSKENRLVSLFLLTRSDALTD
jgi:hypothetical protein